MKLFAELSLLNASFQGDTASENCFSEFGEPYKFTGKELDEETGLYYFGARYYDPVVSQWVSTDPPMSTGEYFPTGKQLFFPENKFDHRSLPGIGGVYNSVNMNVYHYAGQNPVKLVDPDGNALDIIADIGFIAYDIYTLAKDGGYKDKTNWAALGGDVIGAVVPFATGVGAGIRAAKAVDKGVDTSKALKGTANPKVKEAVEFGKKMHKEFNYGKGVKKEVSLPSGKRMDGYDKKNKIIYELKPDNHRAKQKGMKQLDGYIEEANKINGPGHKGVLKTYEKK